MPGLWDGVTPQPEEGGQVLPSFHVGICAQGVQPGCGDREPWSRQRQMPVQLAQDPDASSFLQSPAVLLGASRPRSPGAGTSGPTHESPAQFRVPRYSVYVASFFLELLCSVQTCNCLESRLDDTAPFSASEDSWHVTRKPPDPHLVGARLRASRRPTLFKNFLKFLTLRVELPVSDLSFSNSLHQLHGTGTTLSFSSTEGRV